MLIRHLDGPRGRDLRVSVTDPDATVADLAAALEPDRPVGPLVVDGRTVAASTPLDRVAITHGATVGRPPDAGLPPPPEPPSPVVVLTVTAGPDAGRSVRLAPGPHPVGRATGPAAPGGSAPPLATDVRLHDPTVSRHHATIEVAPSGALRVIDHGSTNGTWIGLEPVRSPVAVPPGAEVRCGASRFVVDDAPASGPVDRPPPIGASRTRPLHRRPRPAPPAPPPPVAIPADPGPPPPVTPVGVVAMLASVATGGALVVLVGSWSYAAFALLGPVLVLANAVDSRRRRRRHGRRAGRGRERELRTLARDLGTAQVAALVAARSAAPGPTAAVRTAHEGAGACWERRSDHLDARTVCIARGRVAWDPPLTSAGPAGPNLAPDVAEVVDAHRWLDDAPVALRLDPGRAVAVVGPPTVARALVRSILVQAVVAHGPADLRLGVLAAPDRSGGWDWCAWLPHVSDPVAGSLLAGSEGRARTVADAVTPDPEEQADPLRRCTLVVIDDPSALAARRSATRTLLRVAAAAEAGIVPIVLVEHPTDVPASCQTVLSVTEEGSVEAPGLAHGLATVVGVAEDIAREVGRSLAGLDDPEVDDPGRDLPAASALAELIGTERLAAPGMAAAWRAGGDDPPPRAVLGSSAEGPFVVDLAADGPHVLVAGTTGAGKSELLRTLVASLAASSSPRHLSFVLIDFKGGSAFDACARLPHVTGVVTDLDDHLAARALRCLDAELRHREQRLRAVGAEDLSDLRRRAPDGEPLPRLVVVVDEFATLAAELPEFVDALVGVAQRGRSLGVHLVLATQRPSGAVSDRIRANTALRVALRVQSAADSTDVIDAPGAATLPRRCPGRALVRLGPGELVAVQVARSSGPSAGGRVAVDGHGWGPAPVAVHRLGVASHEPEHDRHGLASPGPTGATTSSELDRLVDAAGAAWDACGGSPPRRPWPDPLPRLLPWPLSPDDGSADATLVLGLADRPELQRHDPWAWRLDEGPLLAVGLPGSGTTTVAATAVLAATRVWDPTRCHVHVIDLGAGDLEPLAGLPHVGAVIGADDLERQRRLVADLTDDLARRRAGADRRRGAIDAPLRLVVIDGIGAFRVRWPDLDPSDTWERVLSLATDGAAVGIHLLLTAEGAASAPHRLVSACRQRLVLRLGERADHASFGIPATAVPPLPPGRAVSAEGPHVVQVARPPDGLAAAVARLAGVHDAPDRPPDVAAVGRLPRRLGREHLGLAVAEVDGSLALPIGLADVGLVPMQVRLAPGAHAVVAGPPRSGRTTALLALGRAAAEAGVPVVAVAAEAQPWRAAAFDHRLPGDEMDDLLDLAGPLVVLVDDADRTDDDHRVLGELATRRRGDRHVIATARADRLRSLYGHWTRELRADRTGVLLQPDPDLDGDLLGTRLPRHLAGRALPGRGWGCGTDPEGVVQVADSSSAEPTLPPS